MKRAQELAQYVREALDVAGINATVKPYTDSVSGEYVEVVEDRGGRRGNLLCVARLESVSVPRATFKGTVHVDVDHWFVGMDSGPVQWHPDEPPAAPDGEELGPWPGPGTAATEIACAIVRQRVAARIIGHAMAEELAPNLKLED